MHLFGWFEDRSILKVGPLTILRMPSCRNLFQDSIINSITLKTYVKNSKAQTVSQFMRVRCEEYNYDKGLHRNQTRVNRRVRIKCVNFEEQPFGNYYIGDIRVQPPWEEEILEQNSARTIVYETTCTSIGDFIEKWHMKLLKTKNSEEH